MKYLLCVSLCSVVLTLSGQLDSLSTEIFEIQEIIIKDSSLSAETADVTLEQQQCFTKQLVEQSSLYLKSYGLGSLATLSLRGGTAQQTQVQWEGLPIHNPMLGLADLSLVSSGLFSNVTLMQGGQSTYHGSGAICGVLNLQEQKEFAQDQFSLGISTGSFGAREYQMGGRWTNERWTFSARAGLQQANNDFDYKLGNNKVTQSNADFNSKGLLISSSYLLNGGRIKLSYWFQDIHRGIPPTTVQNSSVAFQDDLTHRWKLAFSKRKGRSKLSSQIAYLSEHNDYDDPPNLITARNHFKRVLSTSSFTHITENRHQEIKVDWSHTIGDTKAYEASRSTLSQAGLYLSTSQYYNNLILKVAMRSEWNNLTSPPLLPSLTLGYTKDNLNLKIKFSREYRVPGLNDLFWRPGGNPDLKPEQGWNQELSFAHTSNKLNTNLTLYHRKISDWILWLPSTGFFSAVNIAEVRSQGMEIKNQVAGTLWNCAWRVDLIYHYGQSTYLSDIPSQNINAGDQLIYTPQHRLNGNLAFDVKDLSIQLYNTYTSSVSGINEAVDDFWLRDLQLSYEHKIKIKDAALDGQVSLSVDNLWNKNYRVIERRPMPGRNYKLSWKIIF